MSAASESYFALCAEHGGHPWTSERDAYESGYEARDAVVEGLRAELAALRAAGGQEKPNRCEWCNHAAAKLPAAPVGGQAEPSDAQPQCWACDGRSTLVGEPCPQCLGRGYLPPAAGGPTDAQALADAQSWTPQGEPIEAAARTLYRQHQRHWERDWDETSEAQRTVYRGMAGGILRAAAAVSGEQP